MSVNADGLGLLKAIKLLVFNYQTETTFLPHAMHEAVRQFYICHQGKHETVQAYYKKFENLVGVIESGNGSIGHHPSIQAMFVDGKVDENKHNAQQQYFAVAFVLGADRERFGSLIVNLHNEHIQGRNSYPKTLPIANMLLTNWRGNRMVRLPDSDGIAFTNVADDDVDAEGFATVGNKQKDMSRVYCYNCQAKAGHYTNKCPLPKRGKPDTKPSEPAAESAHQMLMSGVERGDFDHSCSYQFVQADTSVSHHNGRVPNKWFLLDNQSTVDVFHNKDMLQNIRQATTRMDIHCNAGIATTTMVGDFPGPGTSPMVSPTFYHLLKLLQTATMSRTKTIPSFSRRTAVFRVSSANPIMASTILTIPSFAATYLPSLR